MAPEIIYLLKVNAGIALFYAFYKLFCCRDTFFHWRRMALLGFLLLSFLYPLMDMQHWIKEQPAICELADYYALLMQTETDAVPATAADVASAPMPDAMHVLGYIYWGGVVLLSLRFVIQLLSIFRLVWKSRGVQVGHIKVRSLPEPVNPFSFGRWIFVYLLDLEEDNEQEILTHELTHVRQGHSIDVIMSEVVNIICWMNPFSWLLKQEIRLNLEYLADRKVTETVADTRRYQYHLLGLANQKRQTGLYNNFNLSHLKNRIMMMNKKRTCTTGRIKYALFAPLAAALLLVSNIELVARTADRLMTADEERTASGFGEMKVENVASVAEGVVTFRITVTNSEGKPQPDITLQTKLNQELKTAKTNAEGKAVMELDMKNLPYATLDVSSPKSREHKLSGVSADKPEVTIIFDTDEDIDAYIKAGKQIAVKLRVLNTGNEVMAGAELESSSSHVRVTADAKGEAQMKVGVGETITIKQKGYQDAVYDVRKTYPLRDMESSSVVRLLLAGEAPVVNIAETMPEFPGGMSACLEFIAKNVKYPAGAQQAGKQGKVIVQVVVEDDGSLSNFSVVRSVDPELDAEAIRVVKSMPAWKPATVKGKNVRCRYTLPVAFKL